MNIILSQCIKKDGDIIALATKGFESNIIPSAGMYIEDPIWSDESEVLRVSIDYNRDWCTIYLDDCCIDLSDDIEEVAEDFRSNGWRVHLLDET